MKLIRLICWLTFLSVFNNLAYGQAIENGSDWGFEKESRDANAAINDATDTNNSAKNILDKIYQIEAPDAAKYGIRRGCIAQHRIKNIRFKDDQSAIVDMGRGNKALLRLRRECNGIKREGFEYESRQGELCARFARFKVIGRAVECIVESIAPYIDIEDVEPDETL
jgi:hypothetical protein